MLLFDPSSYDPTFLDETSRSAMKELVGFFEAKGLAEMKDEHHAGTWYKDYLDFNAEKGLFAGVATPANVACLLDEVRGDGLWDTARINELNEILGFYSLGHWYAWQVSVLGLGPVWTSANEGARKLVGELLAEREGIELSRVTVRRILRADGLPSPRKRRAPRHRFRQPGLQVVEGPFVEVPRTRDKR